LKKKRREKGGPNSLPPSPLEGKKIVSGVAKRGKGEEEEINSLCREGREGKGKKREASDQIQWGKKEGGGEKASAVNREESREREKRRRRFPTVVGAGKKKGGGRGEEGKMNLAFPFGRESTKKKRGEKENPAPVTHQ